MLWGINSQEELVSLNIYLAFCYALQNYALLRLTPILIFDDIPLFTVSYVDSVER